MLPNLVAALILAQVPNIHESVRSEASNAPMTLRFEGKTADDAKRWHDAFTAKLRSSLGPHKPPQVWKAVLEKRVEKDDHIFEEYLLQAEGLQTLPVVLLIPKGGPKKRAGILAISGHAPRGHYSIADGNAGLTLVKAGYVVAIPCLVPFGRRVDNPEGYGKQDICGVTFVRMMLLGKLLIAENLRDCLWAFEFLSQRPDVDAERIGCVGLSYGGRMSMLTSAVEPRIKVAMVSGALNLMQERIQGRYGCGAQVIPGLLQYGDTAEIGALIAPRPCVWEWGLEDKLIDAKRAQDMIARMDGVYRALGAEKDLHVDRFDGGHTWSWRMTLPVFEKVLRP